MANSAIDVVVLAAVRTPIGGFLGSLSSLPATRLGAAAIAAAVERAAIDPALVEQVFMGQVLQGGAGQAPARQAARFAGLPDSTACVTVNKVCGSGLQAIVHASQAIAAGEVEIAVAGGMESMSLAPYFTPHMRAGARMGDTKLFDLMMVDGLMDAYDQVPMGNFAEQTAAKLGISRAAQDAFARESTERAMAAAKAGHFVQEIVPVSVPQRRGDSVLVSDDDGPKTAQLAKLAGLRPAFTKDGTVTAGNASSISDGAAALVLASARRASELGVTPLAVIRGHAVAARKPAEFTIAPNDAARKLLQRVKLPISAVEAWEINEAFAVVSIANNQLLELDPSKVNVRGGAICLGHPLGASGARILVTLLHVMKDHQRKLGVAALCIGGGEGIALLVEAA